MQLRLTQILFVLVMILITICQCNTQNSEAQEFATQYSAIQNSYKVSLNNATSMKAKELLSRKKNENLEKLLKKYDKETNSDTIILLQAKLLLEISRVNEALSKVDILINKKSSQTLEAQILKVHILIQLVDTDEAISLFKKIETQLKNEDDRMLGWLYLSLYSKDDKKIELYSKRFLSASEHIKDLNAYKSKIYWNLANHAKMKKDFIKAKKMLEKALSFEENLERKKTFDSQLKQLDLIGKTAFPISAETWLNSPPMSIESFRGKTVLIVFWTQWSDSFQKALPFLKKIHINSNKNNVVLIGYSRLYGQNFVDKNEKKKIITKDEELSDIQKYIQTHHIEFPIAISSEGYNMEDYFIKVLPTFLLINKNGNIENIFAGFNYQSMKSKINKLLEKIK